MRKEAALAEGLCLMLHKLLRLSGARVPEAFWSQKNSMRFYLLIARLKSP